MRRLIREVLETTIRETSKVDLGSKVAYLVMMGGFSASLILGMGFELWQLFFIPTLIIGGWIHLMVS